MDSEAYQLTSYRDINVLLEALHNLRTRVSELEGKLINLEERMGSRFSEIGCLANALQEAQEQLKWYSQTHDNMLGKMRILSTYKNALEAIVRDCLKGTESWEIASKALQDAKE